MRDLERRLKKLEETTESKTNHLKDFISNFDELSFPEKLSALISVGAVTGEEINRAIAKVFSPEM